MGLFRFLARMTIGLLFVGHGTQKLFGWFGGGGLGGTGSVLRAGRPSAGQAARAGRRRGRGRRWSSVRVRRRDAAGAAALSGSMITAIKTVHWEKGVWVE